MQTRPLGGLGAGLKFLSSGEYIVEGANGDDGLARDVYEPEPAKITGPKP